MKGKETDIFSTDSAVAVLVMMSVDEDKDWQSLRAGDEVTRSLQVTWHFSGEVAYYGRFDTLPGGPTAGEVCAKHGIEWCAPEARTIDSMVHFFPVVGLDRIPDHILSPAGRPSR